MSLAVFGDVVFEVSAEHVLTFQEMKRARSSRWATHDVHTGKPKREFIGPGLERVTFSIYLDVQLGVDPSTELKKLRDKCDKGLVDQLTVGGELIGDFTLASMDEDHRRHSRDGELLAARASLTLEEYA